MSKDRFCYNCGFPLAPDDCFCSNCGARISGDSEEKKTSSIYEPGSDWKAGWLSFCSSSLKPKGIILTNTDALACQLSGCTREDVRQVIDDYAAMASAHGSVAYAVMDLATYDTSIPDSPGALIEVLNEIDRLSKISYLFIIGGPDVIPSCTWTDMLEDDVDIESDLCYSTLSSASPFSGLSCRTSAWIRVGRLPTWPDEGFDTFRRYFDNASSWRPKPASHERLGMSAAVWAEPSRRIFGRLSGRDVLLSPTYTAQNLGSHLSPESELLYFNLHGASARGAKYWYGQDDVSYPIAFDPQLLSRLVVPYVIGVEACYGARYVGYDADDSTLLSAMGGRCLAFVGSSRIAYGATQGDAICADVLVGDFLRRLTMGQCSGDALIGARRSLLLDSMVREPELKTLAEFSLYGDPALRFFSQTFQAKEPLVEMPDIRGMVLESVDAVTAESDARLKAYLKFRHAEMLSIKPRIYKRLIDDELVCCYCCGEKITKKVLIMVMDRLGKIIKEYVSR